MSSFVTGHKKVYFWAENEYVTSDANTMRAVVVDLLLKDWLVKVEFNELVGIYTVYWGA